MGELIVLFSLGFEISRKVGEEEGKEGKRKRERQLK